MPDEDVDRSDPLDLREGVDYIVDRYGERVDVKEADPKYKQIMRVVDEEVE